MTDQPTATRGSRWGLLAIFVLVAAAASAISWWIAVNRPIREGNDAYHNAIVVSSGFSRAPQTKLDSRLIDSDADMIADAPADSKDLIDPAKLTFTFVPVLADDPNATNYPQVFDELLKHISQVTGKPTEYRTFETVRDQIKAMRDNELQIAGFGTGNVPRAVAIAGFVPKWKLATADGGASYRMQIIVPVKSDIHSPADLKGKEITFTDPGSNSGYKAAIIFLRTYELEPGRDYVLRYSGSHDESIKGIGTGKYQAAAVASDVLQRGIAKGEIQNSDFRVVYESEGFPTASFGYAHNLTAELAQKITQAFESFDWNGTGVEKEFSQSNQTKFVPANFKDDWALIRRIDNETGASYPVE